jgi:hypothetical protein
MTAMYFDRQGNPVEFDEWTALYENGIPQVALAEVGDVNVVTYWLGIDMSFGIIDGPPLIFETTVFGGPLDQQQWRYTTEEAALAGHDEVVKAVRSAEATPGVLNTDEVLDDVDIKQFKERFMGIGRVLSGPAGTAVEVTQGQTAAWPATVASWFLTCPGQSPAWENYILGVVHLRPIEGAPAPIVTVPHATHEVIVIALDPARQPVATDPSTWRMLTPLNVCEQIQLPDDDAARDLLRLCAEAVVAGVLPAEPAMSGAREPWRTTLLQSSAHARGEAHGDLEGNS